MEDLLIIGTISSTHGIRGEVKVYPITDDISRFDDLKEVVLDTGREHINLEIEGVKYFKNQAILKFKGIDNINDVEKYKGKDILVTRENAVELKKNEYYITDLIGLRVITDENVKLGHVTDIMKTGANDVYVVETNDKKEILLPAIKECILDIDLDKELIKIHLMDGLI